MNAETHSREDTGQRSDVDRDAPHWRRALTLAERVACTRPSTTPKSADGERIARWLDESPFDGGVPASRRLAAEGMDQESFSAAVATPPEDLKNPPDSACDWIDNLLAAYQTAPAHDATGDGFLAAVRPLIAQARQTVHDAANVLLQRLPGAPFSPGTAVTVVTNAIADRVMPRILRTLALELNVARLEERLDGETAEQRFSSFVRQLADPARMLDLFAEYPVLARQVAEAAQQCTETTLELLDRLARDWPEIRALLFGEHDPGALTQVQLGAGDTHRGGRSVAILSFGANQRLIYKPRSLAVDQRFQELLGWTSRCGFPLEFRTATVLDRGEYGWAEFIRHHDCNTRDEAQRFFFRQGGFLALVYALRGSDLHYENVIAAGEYPVLVDLETLFDPGSTPPPDERTDERALREVSASVLGTGLLPMRVWRSAESEGIDLGGMVDVDGVSTPHPVPVWEAVGSDTMHLARKRVTMRGGDNLPRLDDGKLDVSEFSADLTAGFEAMYRVLLTHQDELLEQGGFVNSFRDDETRVVLRMSRAYGMLLQEGFHPDVLRDALDRERVFDRLWASVRMEPQLENVIASERRQLWDGDIPVFTTRPGTCDLVDPHGRRISDYFDESGLEMVRQRIADLSEKNLAGQKWFIAASLATREARRNHWSSPLPELSSGKQQAGRTRLLDQACAVGDRLIELAISHRDEVTWNGLVYATGDHPTISPLAADLYEGLPGVALFLARLGHVTGDARYSELAERAMNTALSSSERIDQEKSPGGFYGLGGLIYALTHLGVVWNRDSLLDRAEAIARRMGDCGHADEIFDVIAGAAGGIAALLALYSVREREHVLESARRCGDRLLQSAVPQSTGAAWFVEQIATQPLTGASHGAAGIAWALSRLSAASGDARYLDAARAAVEYERAQFSEQRKNWPNYLHGEPDTPDEVRWQVQWCHGAPGIGLMRAASLPIMDDPETRAEVRAAAGKTLQSGFGFGHCLCHGDLGNLDCLLVMARALRDEELLSQCDQRADRVLASIDQHGWICGVPNGIETPGLMTGLAGIGYGLLRLAVPDVPSVLALEAPE